MSAAKYSAAIGFALFQGVWFASVLGAARGLAWAGPVAAAIFLAVHSRWFATRGEGALIALVAACGALADGALAAAGLLRFEALPERWPQWLVPPWILGLWIAFACLLRHSLRWLAPHPRLAFVFGALGGPLSFSAGVRLGAVALPSPRAGLIALSIEWAILTPLALWWSRPRTPVALAK